MGVGIRLVAVDAGDRGGGFDLLLGDRILLAHRVEAPAFRMAKGHPSVTMVRGNFRHADAPTDAQTPVFATQVAARTFELACSADGDAVLVVSCVPAENDDPAVFTVTPLVEGFDRLTVDFIAGHDEIFWGGGEQMSHLVLNGRNFPMWTSEPGVGREPGTPLTDRMSADGSFAGGDYWTTNYPQPALLSSRGYFLQSLHSTYTEIDLTMAGRVRFSLWSGGFVAEIFEGTTPAELVGRISANMGRQPVLPGWATGGAIVGLKDGDASFDRLERILAAGAAVSGLWCEDWCGIRQTSFGRRLFWDWQWQPARYTDLPARIAALKARGIRFLGYVNPYLAADGPLFAEAAAKGFFARRLDSDAPYLVDFGEFDAGVVDFTNPDAATWFAEEIIGKRMIDAGLDGWMADFGEYLPVDLRLHDGDPMEKHNEWPVLWAEVNQRAVASRDRTGDILWFMRAGFTGVQAHCPLLWAGDQSVDFSRHDGIGTVITAALSSGLVGNAYSHSDVGGYTSLHGNVRTDELMLRWYELGAFSPVMRTHEGNRPEDNLQIDSSPLLLRAFVQWSRVHAALGPWVQQLCAEAATTGLPAQRALFLHYPDDLQTHAIQDQYLYGADLLVAPVIEEGATRRRVYLPGGDGTVWRHMWNGADYQPGWHDVAAPVGDPPVFFRPDCRFATLFAILVHERDRA